jgi:hypothetical protein
MRYRICSDRRNWILDREVGMLRNPSPERHSINLETIVLLPDQG